MHAAPKPGQQGSQHRPLGDAITQRDVMERGRLWGRPGSRGGQQPDRDTDERHTRRDPDHDAGATTAHVGTGRPIPLVDPEAILVRGLLRTVC